MLCALLVSSSDNVHEMQGPRLTFVCHTSLAALCRYLFDSLEPNEKRTISSWPRVSCVPARQHCTQHISSRTPPIVARKARAALHFVAHALNYEMDIWQNVNQHFTL